MSEAASIASGVRVWSSIAIAPLTPQAINEARTMGPADSPPRVLARNGTTIVKSSPRTMDIGTCLARAIAPTARHVTVEPAITQMARPWNDSTCAKAIHATARVGKGAHGERDPVTCGPRSP